MTADHPTGAEARETIRRRLDDYDGFPPHPLLGDWGVEGDREWHQYVLPADERQAPNRPPISVTREPPKADPIARGAVSRRKALVRARPVHAR